jgi:hypothetical protein
MLQMPGAAPGALPQLQLGGMPQLQLPPAPGQVQQPGALGMPQLQLQMPGAHALGLQPAAGMPALQIPGLQLPAPGGAGFNTPPARRQRNRGGNVNN